VFGVLSPGTGQATVATHQIYLDLIEYNTYHVCL